jgi:hypothetical protein
LPEWQSFEAADEPFSAGEVNSMGIEKRMERLRRYTATNGEYFEEV